jgi:hypothetical protein
LLSPPDQKHLIEFRSDCREAIVPLSAYGTDLEGDSRPAGSLLGRANKAGKRKSAPGLCVTGIADPKQHAQLYGR